MSGPEIARDVDDLVRRFVRPDDHLHLAATHSRPNALGYALCRVFGDRARFTISTTGYHSSAHALTLAGGVAKVVAGFLGDTYPSPRPNPLYERVADGVPFAFEPWSLLSYNQRLIAGATGAPYAVTGSLSGTDLLADKGDEVLLVPDPDHPGEQLTLVRAMHPDLTLVHGVCADEDGNIAMVPPLGEGAWAAYAAKRGVIASVERIVSTEELRAIPDRVVIPGQRVLGLCEAPLGAHPQSLRTAGLAGVPGYLDDYAFLEEIVERCRAEERGADWYREWVVETGSHCGYLAKLGAERRHRLRAGEPSWQTGLPPATTTTESATATEPATPVAPATEEAATGEPEATRMERLIVLGARAVVERVRTGGYDTLLAGIGSSHLAAWLAAEQLQRGGHQVKVMAELGLYGFTPQQGDVFLFSLRHAGTAEQLSGIPEILGGMVAANPRALGVLAAAEIDESGTINTSRTADGRWLTGSGGANDIAASADCVVIATASRWRYVPKVAYRTSRGDRVREVVSQFGRFRRDEGEAGFRLATWLEPSEASASARDADRDAPGELEREAAAAVAASTGWSAPVAGVRAEKPVTAEELQLLRSLDPEGRYR
ncbi:CoA-transferase [Kitasatospora kifunensis]|uniref:Acyl CoA:acetate/3-ketoacid CoA transferase alpha subunit/acyl CoA:acetate/3-ketoacid CoA transferase beta subunit n=1 Tax=Kitasatospora kifunensis TaxID=58351 RepID=A0A7W7R4B8_KITKI|nr:CoA-transferase [Kitasatospora kifunensis]MBB4924611.1 acyl CoA:acetate/3-ketoacid CoA transferase alpha subunit/acyl CoA:acetate/3-ketoacid CoA transferase beta subunit [Kitasatospora kifunensis]